ncbi:CDP-alcohol phosphatidyltransferase family protein [Halobellus rubicundus]|uniref:Phosphatidylcholine/phosphatidylserine synthase n=1 Tax=Halobellus rubicundus TaxID=2996466 RepID=A0ABD5MAA3_9EURY
MSQEVREALREVRARVESTDRVLDPIDRTNVAAQLTGADYISLGALFVAWGCALLFLRGEPNLALLAMFGAFLLDKADGWYARRTGESSPFGRRVDSFIDVFAYLVPAALLYRVFSPHMAATWIVGFLILAFGGLRLIRHNEEGFGEDDGRSYYHGTTVVHTNLVVVGNYLLAALFGWSGWLAGVLIAAACPLMISNYKAYKTDASHVLAGIGALVAGGIALCLELGYL